jgi:hypothetical protein
VQMQNESFARGFDFLQAVGRRHNGRPCQGRASHHYDKQLYRRFLRFCHCHPPRIDASRRHISPKCVLGVSVIIWVAPNIDIAF